MIAPTPEQLAAELMAAHAGWRIWWDHFSPPPERRWWASAAGRVVSAHTVPQLVERIRRAEADPAAGQ